MKLTIIGASGHGKVVADIAAKCGYDRIEFLDDNPSLKTCGNWPVVGMTNQAVDGDVFVAIGNAEIRKKLIERQSGRIVTLIHPNAVIADSVRIGKGTVVMAGAVINPDAVIGDGCIINTSSSVDHDCIVEDYAHISVGVHLSGTVHVGKMTWVGAGAVVSNNVNICENCTVGAGAVVIRHISEPGTYAGVPAKRIGGKTMGLTLMYITNNPVTASIAQRAGVDRIWVDMEYIGKELRQGGMNTVQNHHTVADIERLRPVVTTSELMVRINPIHEKTEFYDSSEEEIEATIRAGADVIMLPYFKTKSEVERFISCVNGRAKTMLLFETAEAVENVEEILSVPGIDEVHIGLNDLHLAYHQKFMFELLCDGTVKKLCGIFKEKGYKYGFGGIARVGFGMLPAEYIIAEHYHLGSTAAILSRGFCDANRVSDPREVENIFIEGVKNIRLKEKEVAAYSEQEYQDNLEIIKERVKGIVNG